MQVRPHHWLLEPGDSQLGEVFGESEGLLAAIGAVGIHEQLVVPANGGPGRAHAVQIAPRLAADLHLHHCKSLVRPASELLCQLRVGQGGEAAAAVSGDRRAHHPEQLRKGQRQEPRLQIPAGDVHRRDGHGAHAAAAVIPYLADHRLVEGGRVERVLPFHRPDEEVLHGTRRGEIWMVHNPLGKDPAKDAKFTRYAQGLHEILGLSYRGGWL